METPTMDEQAIKQDREQQRSIDLMMESMHQITAAINRVDFAGALPMAKSLLEFISAAASIKQSAEPESGLLLQAHPAPAGWLRQGQKQLLQAIGMDEKTGVMKIRGTATTGDTVNAAGQVYPTSVWSENLPLLQSLIDQGKLLGSVDHPRDGRTTLDAIAMKYTKLWQEGDALKFEADVLPTVPHGKNLQLLIQNGVKVDISSVGQGTTKKGTWQGKTGVDIVQKGYRCSAFDAVISGSSPGSSVESYA